MQSLAQKYTKLYFLTNKTNFEAFPIPKQLSLSDYPLKSFWSQSSSSYQRLVSEVKIYSKNESNLDLTEHENRDTSFYWYCASLGISIQKCSLVCKQWIMRLLLHILNCNVNPYTEMKYVCFYHCTSILISQKTIIIFF